MPTKDGTQIQRTEGYSCGAGVRLTSGDISIAVLRTDYRKKRRYLASLFANASDGGPRYMQFWVEKDQARSIVKQMKG